MEQGITPPCKRRTREAYIRKDGKSDAEVCPGRGRRFGDSIQTALPSVRVSDRSGSIDRETHPQQGNHRQADDTLSSRPKAVGLSRLKPRLCRRRNPKPCHGQRSPPQGFQLLRKRLRKDLFKDKACRLCAQTSFQNAARLPSSLLPHRLSPHAQEHASGWMRHLSHPPALQENPTQTRPHRPASQPRSQAYD